MQVHTVTDAQTSGLRDNISSPQLAQSPTHRGVLRVVQCARASFHSSPGESTVATGSNLRLGSGLESHTHRSAHENDLWHLCGTLSFFR